MLLIFFNQEEVGVLKESYLLVRVVDEVRREVAAVKLHTFNNFEFVVQALAVFNGDNAFLADFSMASAMMSPIS